MKKIKSNSGITLLSLSLTVAIMLVLSFTIAININDYIEKEKRINLETDILKLQEEVKNYYSKNNSLPIINEYTNTALLKKNINDNDKYYVIDISKLEKINLKYEDEYTKDLNYGKDYNIIENKEIPIDNLFDIYIINEQSHTIYYPKGIQYKGKFYYTIEDESNTKIEDMELAGIEITGRSSGKLNEEIQLTANSVPKFIEISGVTWSSSNTDIAEIDENGKVTLKAVGTATITAVLKDNNTISKDYPIECYSGIVPGESGYEGGAYNDPYIPKGFKHTEGTWNTGYTIKGNTEEGIAPDEFVWVPCVLKEEQQQEAQENGHTVQIFQKKLDYPKAVLEVTGDEPEAEDIRTSVGIYGGFYIAKYEAGIPGTKESVTTNHNTSTTGNILPVSQPNVGVWNFINRTNALSLSNKMINYNETGVHSTLISGAAWDTTLQWITNTVDESYAENSTDKGNYSGTIAVTSSKFTTAYSKNNIYDMAGNIREWTTENCTNNDNSYWVFRGRILLRKWF